MNSLTLAHLHKDIIHIIAKFCDDVGLYFLMQTSKTFARIINYYDINVLGLKIYAITNPKIYQWFKASKIIINSFYSDIMCINAAIEHHNDRVLINMLNKCKTKHIDPFIRLAIKHRNISAINILIGFADNKKINISNNLITTDAIKSIDVDLMQCIVKHIRKISTVVLRKMIFDKRFDLLEILCQYLSISCVCNLSAFDKDISNWCKKRTHIYHFDIDNLLDAINTCNRYIIKGAIEQNYNIAFVCSNLGYICVHLARIGAIDQFKALSKFSINTMPKSDMQSIIKLNNVEIVTYLYDHNSVKTMNAIYKSNNIDMLKTLYDTGRDVNIGAISYILHDDLKMLDWMVSKYNNIYYNDNIAATAVLRGDIGMLEILRSRGFTFGSYIYRIACSRCDWKIYKWMYHNLGPVDEDSRDVYNNIIIELGSGFA